MVFDYYHRLSARQQRIYRRSDEITSLRLPDATPMRALAVPLPAALERADRAATQRLCRRLADAVTERLRVAPVAARVLAVRPSADWGELHGLYECREGAARARITLWMRTAQRRRVVAFRTFLRTLLHEICHHLDYQLLELPDSFHTEGFYKRESSLFHQIVPATQGPRRRARAAHE
ncbi:MAG: hypothetical protein GWO02_08910 [Gammaproteobacteria bacterium]|nr:hypothetical protein [Gammaproteobacteria bacterium]